MIRLQLFPAVTGAIQEACVEMGGHPIQAILRRIDGELLAVDDDDLLVIRDYLDRIQEHLDRKYPNHEHGEPNFDPEQEDARMDELEIMKYPLVYALDSGMGGTLRM